MMRRWIAWRWVLGVVIVTGMFLDGIAADKPGKPPEPGVEDMANLPGTILDDSVGDWVVDRFAGNSMAGPVFYQARRSKSAGSAPARPPASAWPHRTAACTSCAVWTAVVRKNSLKWPPTAWCDCSWATRD